MNINLTTYCNLKCPYCFARDLWESVGNKPDAREISIKNLKIVIDFMKRSGIRLFRMFGGEPTLHTRFEEVYDIVSKGGFDVLIFSNGIIAKEKIEFLSKQKNLTNICINIQEPKTYSLQQYKMLDFALTKLSKLVNLGFVIYKTDFDAYFIIELIEKYNLPKIVKWSIACPSLKNKNVFIKLQDHKMVIKRMVKHSREFKKHRIRWHNDTTFLKCLFNQGQLDELFANVKLRLRNLCIPTLEVAPNLLAYRCYGTASITNPKLKITDFKNAADAQMFFKKREMFLKRVGALGKCFGCDLLNGPVCSGGCLVHTLRSFPKRNYGYIY